MKLVAHGGQCCGIYTIFGMGQYPTTTMMAVAAINDYERHGYLTEGAPQELASDRLKRLIWKAELLRHSGLLEIALAEGPGWMQKTNWEPILTELGFIESVAHVNSNTGRTIHVYHRKSGTVPKIPTPPRLGQTVTQQAPANPVPF